MMSSEALKEPSKFETSTPMLKHYQEVKTQYPDCFVFYQVGDFYEVFFEDALSVAGLLNITLTTRDKKSENPIPMCGIPVAVVDTYVERLADRGYSAVIVSQQKNLSSNKSEVIRYVERLITPGVRILGGAGDLTEGVVAAIFSLNAEIFCIASMNPSSDIISLSESIPFERLRDELLRLRTSEVVLTADINGQKIDGRSNLYRNLALSFDKQRIHLRRSDNPAEDRLLTHSTDGFAVLSANGKRAARLLVSYLDEVTVGRGLTISKVQPAAGNSTMLLDATTRDSLELLCSSKDRLKEFSLYGVLDRTKSPIGSSVLRSWIVSPLIEEEAIKRRLCAVRLLKTHSEARYSLRNLLMLAPNIERIATRSSLGVVSPPELDSLRNFLCNTPKIIDCLSEFVVVAGFLKDCVVDLEVPEGLIEDLNRTLANNPPFVPGDAPIIEIGVSDELDRLRSLRSHGHEWLSDFEKNEKVATGITSLKVKFNSATGYFIDVTKPNVSKVPSHYIRRSTMVNSERFTTGELKLREEEILNASEATIQLERRLFDELRSRVAGFSSDIRRISLAIGNLDAVASLSEVADLEAYTEPEISSSEELQIKDGLHPILLKLIGENVVANSIELSTASKSCLIVTGPNMGGKSTYLRQNALIVLMAQIGSFVPAKSAKIGIVDRVFARIGASDDLREGDSTFMVEMREAANILKASTNKSLVIVDEIGRGTATADGLSLARAILEHLVVNSSCRTLFATHFHELTELELVLDKIANASVGSVERDGQVVFTHQIQSGPANRSYGIEVAKLAGLPKSVINVASVYLQHYLETLDNRYTNSINQLELFSSPTGLPDITERKALNPQHEQLAQEIEKIYIDELSPREAILELYRLKELINQ